MNIFFSRNGQLTIIATTDDNINFSVANLTDEVIKSKNFPERLYGIFFMGQKDSSIITIRCFLDGQYAKNDRSEFYDMEPEYSKQLESYQGVLLIALRGYLSNKGY